MRISPFKIILSLLLTVFVIGCGTSQQMIKKTHIEKQSYNREAMRHVIEGAIYELMGQPRNALLQYHQASEIDTSSAGILIALAENYFIIDEIPTSIRLLKKALHIDPENLDALELLSAAYEQQRQYRKSMLVYEKVSHIKENNINVLFKLTSLQVLTHNYDKALKTYHRILRSGFSDPDYLLQIGNLFLRNRAYKQAFQVYSDLQSSHPDYEPAYLALAQTFKAQGDTTRAIEAYQKALAYNPHFEDAKAELRMLYEKQKRWDDAIALYTRLVQHDTTNLSDKIQLGQFYLQKGDTLSAQKIFEEAVEKHPGNERSYLALAAIQKIMGDTLAAVNTYQKALQKNKDFFTVRRRLKDLYVIQKKWDEAIALYKPLMDNDTTYVGSRIEIANLYLEKGDTLHAIEQCESLMESHGDDWRVPVTLGRYYFLSKQNQKAATFLNKAIQLRDDLPGLWVLRGINFLQMDSLDQALNNFQKSVQKFPRDPEINYFLGTILNRKKKFVQAIKYLNKSLEGDPDNVQTLLSLAAAYDEVHQYDKSEAIYEKLLAIDPERPVILNNYAYHLAVRGVQLDKALNLSRKAIKLEPENGAYLDTVGWIYYQLGDYDSARVYIEKSLKLRKESPEVLEHMGYVCLKLGDQAAAEEYWRKAIEFDETRSYLLNKLGSSSK